MTNQGEKRSPKHRTVRIRDKHFSVYEWAANVNGESVEAKGDPILLLHATGFHARCWDQIIHRLPVGTPIFAIDALCHGKSDSIDPPYHWHRFAAYTEELIIALGITNITGVGHSFGGHLLTLLAANQPQLFKQILLLDPVISDPQHIKLWQAAARTDNPVAKRRNVWSSSEELYNQLGPKIPFNTWDELVFKDYCEFGLTANQSIASNEGYQLACSPTCEAAIYGIVGGDETHSQLAKIDTPTTIVRAAERKASDAVMDFRPSPTWRLLADQFPNASDIYCANRTHFFPMEDPAFVADLINERLPSI